VLKADDAAIEMLPSKNDAGTLVHYLDPVQGTTVRVATMSRSEDGRELRFQIDPRASGNALQYVLRRIRYQVDAENANLTRLITFTLNGRRTSAEAGSEPERLMRASKPLNVTASGTTSQDSAAKFIDAGLHHLKPARLEWRDVGLAPALKSTAAPSGTSAAR
jgi:hypothetical protein